MNPNVLMSLRWSNNSLTFKKYGITGTFQCLCGSLVTARQVLSYNKKVGFIQQTNFLIHHRSGQLSFCPRGKAEHEITPCLYFPHSFEMLVILSLVDRREIKTLTNSYISGGQLAWQLAAGSVTPTFYCCIVKRRAGNEFVFSLFNHDRR